MTEPEETPTPPMVSTLGYRIVRASRLVQNHFAGSIASSGISAHQHAVLSWLNSHGPTYQKSLAEKVGIDPADMVAHLDALQGRNFVERNRDPRDRRRQIITLTEAGREKALAVDAHVIKVDRECFKDFSEEEQEQLRLLADRVYNHIRSVDSDKSQPTKFYKDRTVDSA